MQLTHVIEHRFHRTPDGAIWTDTSYEYGFWQRYLKIFDSVAVVSRVGDGEWQSNWRRMDGPGVRLVPVPFYLGPAQYAVRARQVQTAVQSAMKAPSAVVLRIPSQLGASAASVLWREQRPYAVHVVGDPREAFAPVATSHPLRGLFRWWFARSQSQQCARAAAALYVTPTLRRAYPPDVAEKVLDCSDVNLEDAAFVPAPRIHRMAGHHKLVTVATLSQLYKGIDVLLDAMSICRKAGLSLELNIVGSGKYQTAFAAQARDLGLEGCVNFTGVLPAGAAVRHELDAADLFVLPSRTEGMPRALLEAMARALPSVASSVGGVPEVLEGEDLVPPGDAVALAGRLREVLASPRCLDRMSCRNLRTARRYCASELYPQWDGFFRDLRDRTHRYFRQHPSLQFGSIVHE